MSKRCHILQKKIMATDNMSLLFFFLLLIHYNLMLTARTYDIDNCHVFVFVGESINFLYDVQDRDEQDEHAF